MAMKPGSAIDSAAPQGGNCPLTEPGRTVVKHAGR
jgi:NAD(P) transhydrogenase subunit alpha